jgi:hypothetical protein
MATRTCAGGACNGTCSAGFADCNNNKQVDGCEIHTQTDPNHCGACSGAGTVCSGVPCVNGVCGCPAGFTVNGGRCAKTYAITDPVNGLVNQAIDCGANGTITADSRYNNCSGNYGVTWTDVGSANGMNTVTSISFSFFDGVNCLAAPTGQNVLLNNSAAGSYTEPAGGCTCAPTPIVTTVSVGPVTAYTLGAANTLLLSPGSTCLGFSENPSWSNAFALVTVTY